MWQTIRKTSCASKFLEIETLQVRSLARAFSTQILSGLCMKGFCSIICRSHENVDFCRSVLWFTYLEPETTIYKLFWLEYLQSLDRKWLFNHFHALRKWLLGVPGTNRLWFQSRDRLFPCLDMSHQTRQLIVDATRIDIEITITVDCMKWHFPSFPHNSSHSDFRTCDSCCTEQSHSGPCVQGEFTNWRLEYILTSSSSGQDAWTDWQEMLRCKKEVSKSRRKIIENPPKTNMDTQNSQNFERRYMFKTIMLGIYVKFRGGKFQSSWLTRLTPLYHFEMLIHVPTPCLRCRNPNCPTTALEATARTASSSSLLWNDFC